jgi:protein transport protein SEC61 subunit gamma-like protein
MKVMDKAVDVQQRIEILVKEMGRGKWGRVLKMARKPTTEEYLKTCKLAAVGLILIGALGFLIYWLWNNVPNLFSP